MASFQIEQTPIWVEVLSILKSGKKPVKYSYKGMLHTEKEDLPVLKIISLDIYRDYNNNIGDRIVVEFKMPLGDYSSRLYPFRANLEFSLKKVLLNETSDDVDPDVDIPIEKYKAVFLPNDNPHIATTELEMYDVQTLNNVDIVSVKLDLIDRALEPLRIKTVQGVYRNVTQEQLIRSLMIGESNKIRIEGKPIVDGIHLVEPHNKNIIKHVVLKSGLTIPNIPSYLQETMNGIYTSGIGTYLQKYLNKKLWFVYPLYDTTRFDGKDDKVIFYSVPQERLPGLDRTYNKDGSVLRILVTSTRKYKDNADNDHLNHGVGFRMSDANAFMKKPINLTKDGPKASRTQLNYEVANQERKDGLNYAPVTSKGISANPYTEYSKVVARDIARIDLTWENGNPDMIYPGMPCKYVFLINDTPTELVGVIGGIHSFSSVQKGSIINNTHRNLCAVSILVRKTTFSQAIPATPVIGDF
jgi:hypothetical protein